MSIDPVESNPSLYRVLFENERVRVLEYLDAPGDVSVAHDHPDSVMITLGPFSRRLASGDQVRELDMPGGVARWLGAQNHSGENIGDSPTHCIFVELKEPALVAPSRPAGLGPSD